MTDNSQYGYETKIYSIDKKYEKVFTEKRFLEKINQCKHIASLDHITKDIILEIEKSLLPLKPQASTLLIETRGGNVIATMSLEDFFILLDLGKRTKIAERYPEGKSPQKGALASADKEIKDLLRQIGSE